MDRDAQEVNLDEVAEAFFQLRPRLFVIARRIVGSAAEAEDVLQDVWVRWQSTDRSQILVPDAFLTRVTTRLAINVTKSARIRREASTGHRLVPELADTGAGPEATVEQGQALDLAVRLLLEKLTPAQRAAYILREAFAYSHSEIAVVLDLSHANTRQLVSRARRRLVADHGESVDEGEHRLFVRALADAARFGDMASLEQLLSSTMVAHTGGGDDLRLTSSA